MTTTQTISRERLEEIISILNAGAYGYSIIAEEIGSMARMLLAGMDSEPVAWLYEDELPENYPYDAMFPYSKVDIVRMFPVFAPSAPVVRIGPKINSEMFNSDVIFGYEKGRKEVIENIKAAGIEVENE